MKTFFFALVFSLVSTGAEASFVDCRNSDWFYLSVELEADKDGSSYIRSNESERYTSLSNSNSDPVYVVVNDRELFQLMDDKVYEPRTFWGKSLGWRKIRFAFPSDTSNSETSADLTQLILDSETLANFGVGETQRNDLKAKLAKCGPGRPARTETASPVPFHFYLKVKRRHHKVEGKASVRRNEKYDSTLACCER